MIKEKVKSLLKIVEELRSNYNEKNKQFTLDGRLVGDIGEVLAEQEYKIQLFKQIKAKYDAETELDKKLVQIKATMRKSLCYPITHHPERFLGIKIEKNGDLTEIYNGETTPIEKYLIKRKKPNNQSFYTITINTLIKLSEQVEKNSRIPKRKDQISLRQD